MNRKKYDALFDDKDIMFDAFVDDLADNRCSTFSTSSDATCFISGFPVYMFCRNHTRECYIKCFTDDINFVLKAVKNEFEFWNKNSEDNKDCGTQFVWACEKIDDSTISVYAEKFVEE